MGAHPPAREPSTLGPYSVADYLRRAVAPGASDIRVNGLYGSGHDGAWQFVAHLTWHNPDGQITGGTTTLPEMAGQPTLPSTFSTDRLTSEQQLSWSLDTLDAVLDTLVDTDDALALVNVQIPSLGPARVIACHASAGATGSCQSRDRSGKVRGVDADELLDQPWLDALSVQRASSPVG